MKRVLFIPFLFAFYIGIAQNTNPASIIGNPIKIGNLLVAQNDFPEAVSWDDAKTACKALGKGWRLPTKIELNTLYLNKTKIGASSNKTYWNSTEYGEQKGQFVYFKYAWTQYFADGEQSTNDKEIENHVRAVRTL